MTTHGVPMIAWPLYAGQKMNATMLVEEIGVVVKPVGIPGKGAVDREEIERAVRAKRECSDSFEIWLLYLVCIKIQ